MSTPLAPLSAEERAQFATWADFSAVHAPSSRETRAAVQAKRLLAERDSIERERDTARDHLAAIRRAADECRAAGEATAPRNDPVAREAVWKRMERAEKALRALVEAL